MASIEYFYSAHSGFAYLGSARFMEIASNAGCTIIHKPIDLNRVVTAAGGATFRVRTTAHRDYFFRREIERWSDYRSAPVMAGRPTHHDNDVTLANCLLISGIAQGHNIDQLAHAFLQAHWRDDADLADKQTLSTLVRSAGLDPASLLDAASTPEVEQIYLANTEQAIGLKMFGSPTYVVDGDLFYGQDHLELVERALSTPFPGETAIGWNQ